MRVLVLLACAAVLGCSGGGWGRDAAAGGDGVQDIGPATDATSGDEVIDAPSEAAGPQPFIRPERGEPVEAAAIADITDRYLAMLKKTRYFENIEERTHGWPESAGTGYWYGTWWSGITVTKAGGKVTFTHSPDGADNNGMRTAPMLDGACFAWGLWGRPEHGHLAHKILRGFNSWVLSMENPSHPEIGVLMARAHYTVPFESSDGGRDLYVDTSADRPGIDGEPSQYVHNPDNPWWGDIFVKNIRSKDDIGHMLLSISFLPACVGRAGEGFLADLARLEDLYGRWARRVEDDGWRIATVDKEWRVFFPEGDLAMFFDIGNIECQSKLAVRLYGRGDPGPLSCGDGLSPLDEDPVLKNDFHQINRSFHEAAAALAAMRGHIEVGNAMLSGLAWRIERVLDLKEGPEPPPNPNDSDAAELLISSVNAGVPLTWREVRWLHARMEEAIESYQDPARAAATDLWNPATPDGTYPWDLDARGIAHRYLGAVLGACASPWRNPTGKPVLDCERVKAFVW